MRHFVDEINHDHLMEFRNWLMTHGNEHRFMKNSGNAMRTANRKASHVNQLVRITLFLSNTPALSFRNAGSYSVFETQVFVRLAIPKNAFFCASE